LPDAARRARIRELPRLKSRVEFDPCYWIQDAFRLVRTVPAA